MKYVAARTCWCVLLVTLLSLLGNALVPLLVRTPEPGTIGWGVEDEMSQLLAAKTFAAGRVTNPAHPHWRHFEALFVISQPTYMSKYPPGLPALMAVGIVLSGAPFWGLWLGFGATSGAVTWMLCGWMPRRRALVAAVLITLSFNIWPQWAYYFSGGGIPAFLGTTLMLGAVPRLRRRPVSASAMLGIGAAITATGRPFEGLIASIPIAVVVAALLIRERRSFALLARRTLPAAAVLTVAAAGLAYMNYRTTGSATLLPYQHYMKLYHEVPNFLWQAPPVAPESHTVFENHYRVTLDQYYASRSLKSVMIYGWRRCRMHAEFYVHPSLIPALLALPWVLWRRRMWLPLSIVVLVFGATMLTPWFQPHYAAPGAAALFLLAAQGLRYLRLLRVQSLPAGMVLIPLMIVYAFFGAFERINDYLEKARTTPEWIEQRLLVRRQMEEAPGRDLVIVDVDEKFPSNRDVVFNDPDIDASPIVWARSISPAADRELINYFRDRVVWRLSLRSDEPPKMAQRVDVP